MDEELREKIAFVASEVKRRNIGTFDAADQILALIKEAGWIDPETVVMPGEFGTPKAKELLHQWATANSYAKLADKQIFPRWQSHHLCVDIFSYDSGQKDMQKESWRKVQLKIK